MVLLQNIKQFCPTIFSDSQQKQTFESSSSKYQTTKKQKYGEMEDGNYKDSKIKQCLRKKYQSVYCFSIKSGTFFPTFSRLYSSVSILTRE